MIISYLLQLRILDLERKTTEGGPADVGVTEKDAKDK